MEIGFQTSGLGFKAQGLGTRVEGSGLRGFGDCLAFLGQGPKQRIKGYWAPRVRLTLGEPAMSLASEPPVRAVVGR